MTKQTIDGFDSSVSTELQDKGAIDTDRQTDRRFSYGQPIHVTQKICVGLLLI